MKYGLNWILEKIKDDFGLEKGGLFAGLGLIALVILVTVFLSFHYAPPNTITISSGPDGSIFAKNAETYRKILTRDGITLKILPSKGSMENLQRLNDPNSGVDLGFVQGGSTGGQKYDKLVSLGSISYEPLRIFYRTPPPAPKISEAGVEVKPDAATQNLTASSKPGDAGAVVKPNVSVPPNPALPAKPGDKKVVVKPKDGVPQNPLVTIKPSDAVTVAKPNPAPAQNLTMPTIPSTEGVAPETKCHGSRDMVQLSELAGKRVAIGPEGSGTHDLALALLKLNGIEPGGATTLLTLDADDAAKGLLDGSVDAIFIMGDSASTDITKKLLNDSTVKLYDFTQADAYTRRIRFEITQEDSCVRRVFYLNKLVMPQGMVDLGKNIPPRNITLISPTVELIARPTLHPAIVDLLLEVAREVHGQAGSYQFQGEFPSLVEHEFSISTEAVRYFKSGKSFFYQNLPFWLAGLMNRILLVIVPSLMVLIPSLKIIPALYQWRIKLRIYRWYNELLAIEGDVFENPLSVRKDDLIKRLDHIEESVNQYKVPASFADQFYGLRGHIMFVRERLTKDVSSK